MAAPIWYTCTYLDEFRMPMVPAQYPPEVRAVLLRSKNNNIKYDYSQADYVKPSSANNIWSPL